MTESSPPDDDRVADFYENDVALDTPVDEYPTLADIIIHTIDVGRSLAEMNALYRLSIDAGYAEYRPELARQIDVLEARTAECINEIRRRCREIEAGTETGLAELADLHDAVTPDDSETIDYDDTSQ